jgi:acyl-CoA reductase-like NAD-dependent aldehyde dehydrogenase
MIETINPATGEPLHSYEEHSPEELDRRLDRAALAFAGWRATSLAERSQILLAAAARLEARRKQLARKITEEIGKPIRAAEAEVEKYGWACLHYGETLERCLAPDVVETEATRSYVRYDPLGIVLGIMPWNFPLWQIFRFAVHAPTVLVDVKPEQPAGAEELAPRIDAGYVAVNSIVKSDPRLPFGGIKDSGWGRELGLAGIREFINQKSVWIG